MRSRTSSQAYDYYSKSTSVSPEAHKVAVSIIRCKTALLGGIFAVCQDCGAVEVHYNSCRNRHCPCCQAVNKEKWIDARKADVVDAPYFHAVFTVPEQLQQPLVRTDALSSACSMTAARNSERACRGQETSGCYRSGSSASSTPGEATFPSILTFIPLSSAETQQRPGVHRSEDRIPLPDQGCFKALPWKVSSWVEGALSERSAQFSILSRYA